MFGSINKLVRNKRGAFAMQFALMAVPLTICTGLAIDGGRAFLARFELASALDAAALAVGSTLQNQGTDLNAVAAKFVEKNFRTEHTGPIVLTMSSVEDTIVLKGSVKINTYFMPIVGQPTVTVNAESEVKRGGSSLEIALALDITGSMSTSRMNGLKNAAKILVSEVVNDVQTPFFSKVAIVPWSQAINLDLASSPKNYVPAAALDQLRGALIGPKNVSGASWRASGTTTKTINEAGWRTTEGAKTIASADNDGTGGVDWRWGTSKSANKIKQTTSPTRVTVTTSANHGYTDGQFVRITNANGGFTSLNNNIYMVADKANKTFNLKTTAGVYVSITGSPSDAGAADLQRCFDAVCNVGITTTSAFSNLVPGDFVNITGVTGFPGTKTPSYINNPDNTSANPATSGTWVVAAVPTGSSSFTLANWNGPDFGTTMNSGGGKVSECLISTCRYRVTTSANHSFTSTKSVAIWGLSETGGATSGNSALNTTWNVVEPSGAVFYLPGLGKNYSDWTSGGYAAECALDTCNMRVTTSENHGLKTGDSVELTGINGPTGLNAITSRPLWKLVDRTNNVMTLGDTGPSITNMTADYINGGASQCLAYGCAKLGYRLSGTDRVWPASPCIVERYGDDRYTDVSPASAPLGINYTSNGTCTRTNYVQPMTSNKANLNAQINALSTGGNTAGQLGIGWAWYMLSPNFASVWSGNPENAPQPYGTRELAKIAILMTDGEFNTQTCDGLYSSSDCSPHMPSDVPGPSASFRQARKICDAMKAKNIIIYTVGLEINTAQYSDDFLLACASGPQYAFLANNSTELEQAFKDIAVSINRLRISR